MIDKQFFSARDLLSGPGKLSDRLRECFAAARSFLDTTSVADLLKVAFAQEANRRAVLDVVADTLHIGFLVDNELGVLDLLMEAANENGFASSHVTFASTIVARELGVLSGSSEVQTTVFRASAKRANGSSRYIEAFVPTGNKDSVREWIDKEIGTHIGMKVMNLAAVPQIREAFCTEGFQTPEFMNGGMMTNSREGIALTYFDKSTTSGKLRFEILWTTQR